jgi:1-phosphofructokinase family hexose kinase
MRLVAVAPNPSIDRLYELDRLVRDAVNRPRVETRVAGGKGLNVARAARALGAEVSAVALLAGHAGRWMAEALAAEGIPARLAWADGETRTCLAIHDGSDGTLTELNEAGPEMSPAAWAGLIEALRAELARGDVGLVTISGSLPPGAPADGLAELARTTAGAGVDLALDAAGGALEPALATRPWLVKLNAAEAAATLGEAALPDEAEVALAARRLAARSGGAVVVTRGADGAVAIDGDGGAFRVAAPAVRGPYPVGSGDAFLAGLAVGRLRAAPFVEALQLAGAAAAANALRRGAGRLDPADVERMAGSIDVEPIPG